MDGVYIICIIAAIMLLFFLLGLRTAKEEEKKFCKKAAGEFGKAPSKRYKSKYDRISGYHEKHVNGYHVDDITWNDLSMVDVFDRINYCESFAGEEYLYYMLRNPLITKDGSFSKMEEELSNLSGDESERIRLKLLFHKIGKSNKYSIYDYLDLLNQVNVKSNGVHYCMLVLMILSVLVSVFWNFTVGFLLLLLLIAVNIVTYFREKAKIEPYLVTFSYVIRLLNQADSLIQSKSKIFSDEVEELSQNVDSLKGFAKGSWILMSGAQMNGRGNPLDMLSDYVRMITHIDLIKFNNMLDKLSKKLDEVDNIARIMGRMDAVISICYYRESLNGNYCIPEFIDGITDGSDVYDIKDGYHPLLTEPVPNSVELKKGILLTGSNASGKSTFLKMCAINTIFAQSIHTCLASNYKAPMYRIYSSMALKDDLTFGDSYYMVEIKSLKRILDSATEDEKTPVLCFIDEVLRGTNTVERISASTKVLEYFAGKNVCCFAATHDIELSSLLSKYYEIYHFEGNMEGDDVRFDYKLKEGPATNRNAIKLLKTIGYQDSIVEEAEAMAQRFENSGTWKI